MEDMSIDADEVQSAVAELLERVDELVVTESNADDDMQLLAPLARQAELLEQAHTVLTETLDKIDRV